jgi:hypothetical protein
LHALNARSARFSRRSSLLMAPSRAASEGIGDEKPLEVGKDESEEDEEDGDADRSAGSVPEPFVSDLWEALGVPTGSFG